MAKRNSSIELLRIVLMVFIVAHHGIVHGLGLAGLSGTMKDVCIIREGDFFLASLLNAFFIIAVNSFVLVSGFFSIQHVRKKGIHLVSQLLVCTFLFTIPYYLIKGDIVHGISNMLILSHSRYWFIIDYFILMAFAPALNLFFENKGKRMQLVFVIALVFVSCYLGFVWEHVANNNGHSVIQFITLYSIGRYLHNNPLYVKRTYALIVYVACAIVISIAMLLLHYKGYDSMAWRMTQYNNPLLYISAISFIYFFHSFNLQSDFINKVANSSLFIYLFSCSASIEKNYYLFIGNIYECQSDNVFFVIILSALLISLVAVTIDQILVSRLVPPVSRMLNKTIPYADK